MRPERQEIWIADLGIAAKERPVVIIVSNHDEQAPRDLVIYVPCTTQYRSSKYEVALPPDVGLKSESWANVQGIASIPSVRFVKRIGKLPDETWGKLREAIRFALDL